MHYRAAQEVPLSFRWMVITAVAALALTGPGSARALPELPELGGTAADWLTPEQEHRLGRAWLRQMHARVSVLNDPLVQEYTEDLVYRLASHGRLGQSDLAIVVVNSRNINAFAVPGGVVGLNAGLFLHAEAEDEVAGVIAHELAHISQNHFARRQTRGKQMNRAMLAAMLASLAAAIAGETQAGMAGMAASQAGAIQSQLAYSRHHEREADRVGMQTLARAGFDPMAMPDFFQRMLRRKQFANEPPEFLLTHPLTKDRIADSRARAARMERPGLDSRQAFHLIRARVRARFFADAERGVRYFEQRYDGGTSIQEQAGGYGLALALIRAEEFERADQVLEQLRSAEPNELWYALARGELAAARQDHATAVERFREVLNIMPGNHAASVMLARNLLRDEQADQARELLDELLLDRPRDPYLWQMLADAHGQLDHGARAHRARGEYLFLTGRADQGMEQMGFALEASEDDFSQHSRIESRLKEMRELHREAQEF